MVKARFIARRNCIPSLLLPSSFDAQGVVTREVPAGEIAAAVTSQL